MKKLMENLKGLFKKEEEKEKMPYRFLAVRWTESSDSKVAGGTNNKEIVLVEGGREKKHWPFTRELVDNLSERLTLPIFDETEGKNERKVAMWEEHNPGVIRNA